MEKIDDVAILYYPIAVETIENKLLPVGPLTLER